MWWLALATALLGCGRVGFGDVDSSSGSDGELPPCTTSLCDCQIDADCTAPHTYCAARAGAHTCDCVAGYADQGAGCTWVGVVTDPGFMDPTAWTTSGMIDPAQLVANQVDPGAAILSQLQRVSQTITMPRLSRAELLVAQLSASGYHDSEEQDRSAVGIAGKWTSYNTRSGFSVQRSCLGAAMYAPESSSGAGVPLTLEIMPDVLAFDLEIDRIEIVPAMPDECAPPGGMPPDGDAETDGHWQFSAPTDGSFAGFAATGQGGTRGARLYMSYHCDTLTMSLPLSVPSASDMPSPALSYWVNANSGSVEQVGGVYDGVYFPAVTVNGTGAGATTVACLPPSWRGRAATFGVVQASAGTCAQQIGWDATFDNIAVINEPACGTEAVADPGFESGLIPMGASWDPGLSSITIATGAGEPHAGSASLRLGTHSTCHAAFYEARVTPLPSSSAGGPALAYYYRATPPNNYVFFGDGPLPGPALVLDNAWHRGVTCFDPQLAGRDQSVMFGMSLLGSTCDNTFPEEYAYVDDLQVTNDPACAQ